MTHDAEGNLTAQEEGQWRWERDESGRGGWWAVSDADGWQAHRYWTPHAFSAMQWLVDTLNDKFHEMSEQLNAALEENAAYALAHQMDADTLASVKAERDAALAENERLRAALNSIASWGEGPEVTSMFDEPGSAQAARDALTPGAPARVQEEE